MGQAAAVVEVGGASVSLGGRPIVRDIDLSVHAGEVVALLGPNGSGKSTLVKAMVGLYPLSAGAVRLFDEPVDQFRQWHRLGYVPQRSPIAQGVPSTVAEWSPPAASRDAGPSCRRAAVTAQPSSARWRRWTSPTTDGTRFPRCPAASSNEC